MAADDFLGAGEPSRRGIGVEIQLSVYSASVVRQKQVVEAVIFPTRVRVNSRVIELSREGPYSLSPQRQEGTSHGLRSRPCLLSEDSFSLTLSFYNLLLIADPALTSIPNGLPEGLTLQCRLCIPRK